MSTQNIEINRLKMDKAYQMRLSGLNIDSIESYAESMRDGAVFPAIHVFDVGSDELIVVDGFHRVRAAAIARLDTIEAVVHQGTEADALDYAQFTANRTNGMRLTRIDLQSIVMRLVTDDKYAKTPSSQLAEIAGVSHTMVVKARERLDLTPTTVITASGVERKVGGPRVDKPTYITGAPQLALEEEEGDVMETLAAQIIERLDAQLAGVRSGIKKLQAAELVQYLPIDKQEAMLAESELIVQELTELS